MLRFHWYLLLLSCFLVQLFLGCRESSDSRKIAFNAEIRPILNEHCVPCHGGVKQSGGFGLVFRENALKKTDNGKFGVVPGKPHQSEMYRRISHHDPEFRMPLEEDPLSQNDINLIEKWIEQGAHWQEHWAYLLPQNQTIPQIDSDWPRNEIDNFVLDKIQKAGLSPSTEADRATLVRRLYLDLIGLPPTMEQAEAFIKDKSENAYETLVERLLASPQYGEHWASMWLDMARYADSFGYSADVGRVIWKYRDWVIRAFNQDMPFDQFTIEQLAGDLLPDPSDDQLIATAFHRNSVTNGEGGAYHEEFRIASVIDRINTTWESWQATTMGCVQCHNHPYDPIRQTDFYSSFAFFNQTNDRNLRHDYPLLRHFEEADEKILRDVKEWINQQGNARAARQMERMVRTHQPKIVATDFDKSLNTQYYNRTGDDFMTVYDSAMIKIKSIDLEGIEKFYLHYQQGKELEARLRIHINDSDSPLVGQAVLKPTQGFEMRAIPINTKVKKADLYLHFDSDQSNYKALIDGLVPVPKLPGTVENEYPEISSRIDGLMNRNPKVTTPIMMEKQEVFQRKTHLFIRGNWLDPAEEVQPGLAAIFVAGEQDLRSRLDLARWLVSDNNPLTARVIANRIWARLFGRGIVQTLEDFGTMGDSPTHPELLDWMALHFSKDLDWQLKKLIKSIVLSATYRQSSKVKPELLEKDPENVWLARSPRLRLSAEQVRDQALLVSGLLSTKMYGPGVMPVQPEGIWKISFDSNAKWKTSEGEDRYRRAVYTYIKRSAPYPSFITFDAAGREVCLSRRITTNTPLQALVTLNDPVYFETAKVLAGQIIDPDLEVPEKIILAYSKIMGKAPSKEKVGVLQKLYTDTKDYYLQNQKELIKFMGSAELELAIFTIIANSLMNMDEFISRS